MLGIPVEGDSRFCCAPEAWCTPLEELRAGSQVGRKMQVVGYTQQTDIDRRRNRTAVSTASRIPRTHIYQLYDSLIIILLPLGEYHSNKLPTFLLTLL